jgi:hypothetical protein
MAMARLATLIVVGLFLLSIALAVVGHLVFGSDSGHVISP